MTTRRRVPPIATALVVMIGLCLPPAAGAATPADRPTLHPLVAPPAASAPAGTQRDAAPPWTVDASPPGVRDPARGLVGRWERELSQRTSELARRRGADPSAVVALLGALPRLHGDVPAGELEAMVDSVRGDAKRHPLVRGYASILRARLHEASGDIAGAGAMLGDAGVLLSWQIVGPFDNAGHAGEGRPFAPEKEAFDPDQTMFGKLPDEPLTWRSWEYEGVPQGGYVSFDEVLRPNEEVVAYATCWVHVPAETGAVLHLGTGGAYTAFVDGQEIGSGDAERLPHPLQDAHGLTLEKGWNRVMVKVAAMHGMWGFFAGLRGPDGKPLPGLKVSGSPPPDWTPRNEIVERTFDPGRPLSLRQSLEQAYDKSKGKKKDRAGLALVQLYRWVHPFDRDDDTAAELAREVDARVKTSESSALRYAIETDPKEARTALVTAIDRARDEGKTAGARLTELLLQLAWRERSLGLEDRYRALIDEAMLTTPDDALIELALADRVADDGYPWLGLSWIRDMVGRYPESQTLHGELASRLRGLGRTREALSLLEALHKRGGGQRALAAERIDVLMDLGEADRATALARSATLASPGLPDAFVTLSHLEEARGDLDAARAALGKAIALAPHDALLHSRMGRLLVRAEAIDAAMVSLQRSLELRPQQPDVRDLLAALDTRAGDDMLERYGLDFDAIGELAAPKTWAGKEAGILHHRVAVRVLDNGLTERLDHRVIRILDDRGIRSQSMQGMAFDPAESTVEVRRARVRRADGTVEELGDVGVVGLASAGYRMFYDQRQIRVHFPGLEVGDTVEVAFVRRDLAARNMFDEYFGDLMPLQGTEPRLRVDYILEAPKAMALHWNKPVKQGKGENADTTVYRLTRKDVAGLKPEPSMPGWTEFADYLHVSTYETWDDVGRWYWDLVSEQLVVDEKIREGVAEALTGLPPSASDRDKAHALYTHVVRNTRYVGLEFGIHGYKPYRTTDVYRRRFGDCKDKASLLKVMLAEVGIDSHLALVRTRDQGVIDTTPASLAAFNHAIVYVPGLDLWLDGTAEWSGPTELPTGDQGASALVVKDGSGADFVTIPVSPADHNRRTIAQVVELSPDGAAKVRHDSTVTGASASQLRYSFQAPEQRRERLEKAFASAHPGAEVQAVEAPDLGDITKPAQMAAELTVPAWAKPEGKGMRFATLGRPSSLQSGMAPQADRKYPMVLDSASVAKTSIEYRLPPGYRFARTPTGKTLESKVGKFSLTVEPTARGAKVSSELTIDRMRIEPQDYAAFREFLRKVDETLEQTFEVVEAK